MKELINHYNLLQKVYSRLEDLTSTAIFKAMRSAECLNKPLPNSKNKNDFFILFQEEEHDHIAYSDAINLKFGLYYNLTFKYLKLYLKEIHGITLTTPKRIIEAYLKLNLINNDEAKEFFKMIKYANSIVNPYNESGDYEFSDGIISYTTALNDLVNKLNSIIDKPKSKSIKSTKELRISA